MDLSTSVSSMSGGAAASASPASSGSPSGSSGGAVACPVCTLYLREGISLQKHLDTHPKEQVIEALIRASAAGGPSVVLASQFPTSPSPQPAAPVQTPTSQPMAPVTGSTQQSQPAPASPSPHHVPHAQSPYPIGPIFECPTQINAMIPPPQFASFSYQQFVNNGTMMIPAQYAMAQAQAPPTSQMMQMLYSPYGMYHQQQIPTVQMISAPAPPPPLPPQAMMPSTTAPLPVASTVAAATTRMRPAIVAATPTSVPNHAITASVNENSTVTMTTTSSPPRPTMCAPEPPLTQMQQTPPSSSQHQQAQSQQQHQHQHQQESMIVDQSKEGETEQSIVEKTIPGPDRILPDLVIPESPEQVQDEQEDELNRSHSDQSEQSQNDCDQDEQSHDVGQYHREDQPTLTSNSCEEVTDDDKTERILPDIEDNEEIESLIVRTPIKVESHKSNDRMEVTESVQPTEIQIADRATEKEFVENIHCNEIHSDKELDDKSEDVQIIEEAVKSQNTSPINSRTSSANKPENEQMNRLLDNMESELSNIDLSSKEHDNENNCQSMETEQNSMNTSDPLEKQADEDEATNTSYHKNIHKSIECKIIVSHEDTDVSSVASSDDGLINDDMETQKMMLTKTFYQYKYSQSAPNSPANKKKFRRPISQSSLPLDLDEKLIRDGSNENVCQYPEGFEATSFNDILKDNYNDEDMDLEEEQNHSYLKKNDGIIQRTISRVTLSSDVCMLKSRRSNRRASPVSVRSSSPYCQIEDEEEEEDEDSDDADSMASDQSNDKDEDDEEEEEEEEEDDDDHLLMSVATQRRLEHEDRKNKKETVQTKICTTMTATTIGHQQQQQQQSTDFRSQSLMTEHYSTSKFSTLSHHSTSHQQQHIPVHHHETYPLSNSNTSQNLLNMSECVDPTTSIDSKSYNSSSPKSNIVPKPSSTELLNINEDAHAGPINVFEFDGLQILVPSTFISESSQKAVSGTSQQSMSSSENDAGNDEEVKSVNMRADETMPARGELSEQESNGCTEQGAWQLYMTQDSSRMSSYDLMARESWEESEGSEHEDNNSGQLIDSRFITSSLFLDRDRKTPTRRIFKCSHCPEVFECPKERRVHSTMVHKEAGPSSCSNDNADQPELKEIKLLEGRTNGFDDIFVPSALHLAQQAYQQQHLQQQQPLLHQMQPPQQHPGSAKTETDVKLADGLHLAVATQVTCSLCSQRFSSEKTLQIHHRRMHITEPIKRIRENTKCQICNEEFTSVANFNLHLKIHPLECGTCGKYFYRKQNFKLHMKRHLGIKPFPCSHCNKAFLTKQKLDEHTNGHTGNAPVKCNLCNETFRRYSNLTQHKNRHHLNIKKKLKDYICHCGEVFHTKKKLAWHKETHDEKPKACTYCNERFIHMASLTRHMRRAHNRRFVPDAQRESENVECPICKCIYLRSSLAVHMRVHNGERPYECQVCSKSFSTKWNLQLHKWTHAARSTKPFKCNQCSAAFYRHSDYTAHMNSHRNVRPYTCNYCGAQFIRKYNCLRHVKEHEENKAYTCEICNKTFHRSYYLKEHLRVHSGARPYTCHICGKSSSTKSNHNKHVRIHHAREPVNTEN